MPETAQQYTRRILSNALGQDPIKIQSKTNRKLGRLIKGVRRQNFASGRRRRNGRWRRFWLTLPTSKS